MSAAATRATKSQIGVEGHEGKADEAFMPFNILSQSELLWWPYRSLSKAILQTHRDTRVYLEINRRLLDDLRRIVRREQELVLDMSEKLLEKMNPKDGSAKGALALEPGAMEEICESAIAGIRELGQALSNAQVQSIEAFREHARKEVSAGGEKAHRRTEATA